MAPLDRDWRSRLTKPETVTDLLQIIKSVLAATVAWWLSDSVLTSALPFLAPWTALLTVHATVYRSLSRGAQTTVASTVGVALSFVIGAWLGVSIWTFALALLVGLLGARLSWIRDEGVAIATTAIFVLGSGFSAQQPLLLDRILEVAVGVGVGIVVNLLLIPPLRHRQASRYVDSINRRMGDVLINMADELADSWDTDRTGEWFEETESMSAEIDSAWQTVRFARESERANPRPDLRRRRWVRAGTPHGPGTEEASYENILERVGEGVSHLRHLARTLSAGDQLTGEWDSRFRERWVAIVRDTGRAIADPDGDVAPVHDRLVELSVDLSGELPPRSWPLYGSLIASMEHIAVVVDDVASARAARAGSAENPPVGGDR